MTESSHPPDPQDPGARPVEEGSIAVGPDGSHPRNPTSNVPDGVAGPPNRRRRPVWVRLLLWGGAGYLGLSAAIAWMLVYPPRRPSRSAQELEVIEQWAPVEDIGAVRQVRIPALTSRGALARGDRGSETREAGPSLGASYRPGRTGADAATGAFLLLHGRGGHRGNMSSLARSLALDTPWAILTVDQRASGTSDDAPSTAGIGEADDVRAALAFLSKEGVPADRTVVIGISQGAVAALLASADAPLAGLALLAPYDDLAGAIDRRVQRFSGLPRVPFWIPMCWFGERFAGRTLFDVDLIESAELSRAARKAVWCREEDWRAPLAGAERIAVALDAQLFVHPGKDHWLLGGRGSEAILTEVLAFATQCLPGK